MQSGALSSRAGRLGPVGLPIGGDERLARLAGAGSERAFAVIYERYHQRLYRYVRSMLRHDADAQDALQSTFAKAFDALSRGQRDAPLRPWLFRIAHNEAITVVRRRRPEAELSVAGEIPTRSAAEEAGERARLALLVADLAELTERQRGALVMRELSGLSHEEIETALGLSAGQGKQTVLEARRSLAEFAEGRAMLCDEVCRAISEGSGRTLRGRRVRAHLRDCRSCAAFATAIPARSRDLRALAPPLPAGLAAGLFARSLGASSAPTGSAGTTGLVAGAASKAAAVTISSKVLAGAAILATATAAAGAAGAFKPVFAPTAPTAQHGAAAGRAGARTSRAAHASARPDSSSTHRRTPAASQAAGTTRGRSAAHAHHGLAAGAQRATHANAGGRAAPGNKARAGVGGSHAGGRGASLPIARGLARRSPGATSRTHRVAPTVPRRTRSGAPVSGPAPRRSSATTRAVPVPPATSRRAKPVG